MDFGGLVCAPFFCFFVAVIPASVAFVVREIFYEINKYHGKNLSDKRKSRIFVVVFVIMIIITCLGFYFTTKDWYVM